MFVHTEMLCHVYFIIYIYAHSHGWDPSHTDTQGPKLAVQKKKKKRTKAMKTPPNHKMKSGESETISINPQKNSDGQ